MIGVKKISNKKIILYGVIIILMVLGNVFIYFYNTNVSNVNLDSINKLDLSDINSNQSKRTKTIIEHNLFITLEKIGDWPVVPKNVGKVDPFVPFFQKNN